jgi:L-asparaginase
VGYVDTDRVIFRRAPFEPQKIHPAEIDDNVFLIKLFAGADDTLFNFLVEKKVSGIVVEGFGRGNVSPGAFKGMKRAVDNGIPVVITTRCLGGRVLDVYAYDGGVKRQIEARVIPGGEINGQKARIKLILALGTTREHKKLGEYFDKP